MGKFWFSHSIMRLLEGKIIYRERVQKYVLIIFKMNNDDSLQKAVTVRHLFMIFHVCVSIIGIVERKELGLL